MMSPSHVAAGLALAAAVATYEPRFALPAAIGGAVGGAAPDLDLFVGDHRKTLHFPVYAWGPATAVAFLAVVVPTALSVGLAVGVLAVAVHSASDVLGAGDELRPWERTSPYAVYCHACGRWLRARYVFRYDGSPEDFALTVALSIPALVVFSGAIQWLTVGVIVVGGVYAIVRKRVVRYFEPIVE